MKHPQLHTYLYSTISTYTAEISTIHWKELEDKQVGDFVDESFYSVVGHLLLLG